MDEVKSKFKQLLNKASNIASTTGTQFSGQGHRLGTAEEHGIKPKPQGARAGAGQASSSRAPPPRHVSSPPPHAQPHELKPATEFSPFTAVIGSGAALSAGAATATPAGPQQHAPSSSSSSRRPPAAGSSGAPNAPQQPERQQVQSPPPPPPQQQQQQAPPRAAGPPPSAEQLESLQHCVALIASQPAVAGSSMAVLAKLLGNLAALPHEPKYRQLRLANTKVAACVVAVPGALELLAAAGFELMHADASEADGGFAVFLDDDCLPRVHAALSQLQAALPAAQQAQAAAEAAAAADSTRRPAAAANSGASAAGAAGAASTAAAAAAAVAAPQPPPVARDTQVLLPATPDTAVPDSFFERCSADIKAEYLALRRAREAGQVIASRTWKEAQRGGAAKGPPPTAALVRVRFPEGVCLQGRFGVGEPLTAVFEWTTDALRHCCCYELILPDRRPLPATGTVGAAGLAPSMLLNFFALDGGSARPFLSDRLLQQARAD